MLDCAVGAYPAASLNIRDVAAANDCAPVVHVLACPVPTREPVGSNTPESATAVPVMLFQMTIAFSVETPGPVMTPPLPPHTTPESVINPVVPNDAQLPAVVVPEICGMVYVTPANCVLTTAAVLVKLSNAIMNCAPATVPGV